MMNNPTEYEGSVDIGEQTLAALFAEATRAAHLVNVAGKVSMIILIIAGFIGGWCVVDNTEAQPVPEYKAGKFQTHTN